MFIYGYTAHSMNIQLSKIHVISLLTCLALSWSSSGGTLTSHERKQRSLIRGCHWVWSLLRVISIRIVTKFTIKSPYKLLFCTTDCWFLFKLFLPIHVFQTALCSTWLPVEKITKWLIWVSKLLKLIINFVILVIKLYTSEILTDKARPQQSQLWQEWTQVETHCGKYSCNTPRQSLLVVHLYAGSLPCV
jgi:hypothetical protein